MSLEDRGYRPRPGERGAVAAYLWPELDREVRRWYSTTMPTVMHELLWGVPCGPTLSMLPTHPGPQGIASLWGGTPVA